MRPEIIKNKNALPSLFSKLPPIELKCYKGYFSLQSNQVLISKDFLSQSSQGILFHIQGEITGIVYFDWNQNSSITTDEMKESANILLGHILTNLDKNHNIMAIPSTPLSSSGVKRNGHHQIQMKSLYKYSNNLGSEKVKIIFTLNKTPARNN